MEFLNNKLLIALVVAVSVYALVRLFLTANKSNKVYKQQVEQILNSDEHKVKGRFED